MLYPKLVWCIKRTFGSQYRLAGILGESETWLSHRLTGRVMFTGKDRERIAKTLGYPVDWLFEKPVPPTGAKERPDPKVEPSAV